MAADTGEEQRRRGPGSRSSRDRAAIQRAAAPVPATILARPQADGRRRRAGDPRVGAIAQEAACHRAVRNETDALRAAERQQLALILAPQQIVVVLHCNEACETAALGVEVRGGELPERHAGDADVQHLADSHEMVERLDHPRGSRLDPRCVSGRCRCSRSADGAASVPPIRYACASSRALASRPIGLPALVARTNSRLPCSAISVPTFSSLAPRSSRRCR